MATTSIQFANHNAQPIFIQVDPWAAVYQLDNGQIIEFVAQSESNEPQFSIDEHGSTRILTIVNFNEFLWSETRAPYIGEIFLGTPA